LGVLAYCVNPFTLIIICLGSSLSYAIFRYYKFVSRYPKGPFPLPFIDNLDKMEPRRIDKFFGEFGKTQPPIYTIFMPFPTVQITDYDVLREAFVEKGNSDTGNTGTMYNRITIKFPIFKGVINSNGETWREQRRAAISIMRDFGMGKNVMEELVRSSLTDFLQHLDKLPDKSNVDLYWPPVVANVINEILFGYRYAYDDCKPLIDYVTRFNELMESVSENLGIAVGMAVPSLAKLPWIGWHIVGRIKHEMQTINKYVVDNVGRALKDYGVEDEPTCFVHSYKQRIAMNEHLDDLNLMATCADFFIAGQETTSTTLRWAMLIMAKHGDVQEKLRSEIHSVVGMDRLPMMADQVKMPFARACALELQRFANVLGMNVQRVTVNDVTIRDVTIPAGTWVNGDIHYLMANDPHFVNPQEFRPERYLNDDGVALRRDLVERTLPFSLGKRVCARESLARAEIFLGLTAIIQHYRILLREGEVIDLEPTLVSTFVLPKAQNFRIE
ncbi:hypothetical protein PMAYCL1PPCAC_15342, partial [Pristionchus mayeri]